MSKSILDHAESQAEGARVAKFTEIDRAASGPSEATKTLQRRARALPEDGARAEEYVRIERGQTA